MSQLRLHGIRRNSIMVEDGASVDERSKDPLENMAASALRAREEGQRVLQRAASTHEHSGIKPKPAAGGESLWKRRHSIIVAQKNNDWAEMYLSTAATEDSMAGFLSLKGNPELDAEYFYNFIPKAVANQDVLYKDMLAVFNALHYWGPGLMKGRKVLVAIGNQEAGDMIKSANVKGKVGPQKIMLLKEINETCKRYDIELRIAETEGDPEDMIAHALAHSNHTKYKEKFQKILLEQSRIKGQKFTAKERLFPPSYV